MAEASDAEKAESYRAELRPILAAICEAFDRAQKDGMVVNFRIDRDAAGRAHVTDLSVIKPL